MATRRYDPNPTIDAGGIYHPVPLTDAELDGGVANVLRDRSVAGWTPGSLPLTHLSYYCRDGSGYGGDLDLTFPELMASVTRLIRARVMGLGARDATEFVYLEEHATS